ncbi:LysR family transcriptional regulator [bacterium]|nr:LysR family transcriptional regulator [bacterium]
MHLDDLRVFLDLAESGHFGRAAEAGHRTVSAVSRTLTRLERAAGQRLFDRSPGGATLTPAGEAFRRFAADTLGRYADLRVRLGEGAGGLTGTVTVYGTATAAAVVLAPVLRRFRDRHPGVRVAFQTGDVEAAFDRVRAGSADVAVAIHPGKSPTGVHFRPVTTTTIRVYATVDPGPVRAALAQQPVAWANVPVVAPPPGPVRERLDRWFRARGAKPHVVATVAGSEALLGMVGLGFGIGPAADVVVTAGAGKLVEAIPGGPRLAPLTIGLCCRADRERVPEVRALLDAARHAES